MKRTIQVGAAIVQKEGLFLIAQRHSGDHLGDYWEFPGGKKEENEDFPGCLRRELREELGIEISVGRLWKVVRHDYAERTIELHFYFCRYESGEPQRLDCQDFRWIRPHEFKDFKFPPADAELIEELSKGKPRG